MKKYTNLLKQWYNIRFYLPKTPIPKYGPTKLRCNVTYSCNSRCVYCQRWKTPKSDIKKELSTNEWKRIIKESFNLGTVAVHFTGGEPLMRKDIFDLVKYSKSLGVYYVHMNSNGILLKRNVDNIIKSKLDALTISLDSIDDNIYKKTRGIDGLDLIKSGISELLSYKNRPKVGIATTITQYNVNDVENTLKYAKSIGLDYVCLTPLIGDIKDNVSKENLIYVESDKELKPKTDFHQKLMKIIKKYRGIMAESKVYYENFSTFFKNPDFIKSMKTRVPSINLRVDPYGNVHPFEFSNVVIDNLRNKKVKDVWFSSRFNKERIASNNGSRPLSWIGCENIWDVLMEEYNNKNIIMNVIDTLKFAKKTR